jgi:Spy/CpxP family protein refolding chaperone
MNPLRTTLSAVCIAATLGGVGLASAATQPSTPNAAQNTGSMQQRLHDGRGGPRGLGAGFQRILDQLNLSAEQTAQIRSLTDQAKPRLQALQQSARANRDQLEVTPPTDPAYNGILASAKSNAVEQIQLMSDLWTQAYAKLTPDQRAQIPGIVAAERAEWEARKAGRQKPNTAP